MTDLASAGLSGDWISGMAGTSRSATSRPRPSPPDFHAAGDVAKCPMNAPSDDDLAARVVDAELVGELRAVPKHAVFDGEARGKWIDQTPGEKYAWDPTRPSRRSVQTFSPFRVTCPAVWLYSR